MIIDPLSLGRWVVSITFFILVSLQLFGFALKVTAQILHMEYWQPGGSALMSCFIHYKQAHSEQSSTVS